MTTNQPLEKWERFEKIVFEEVEYWCSQAGYAPGYGKMKKNEILNAAKVLLVQQRKEIVEKIEEMRKGTTIEEKYWSDHIFGYNKALSDIIAHLQGEGK